MDMDRELATYVEDLPHDFTEKAGEFCRKCGHTARHPLHNVIDIEQASHTAPLQTEKGS